MFNSYNTYKLLCNIFVACNEVIPCTEVYNTYKKVHDVKYLIDVYSEIRSINLIMVGIDVI